MLFKLSFLLTAPPHSPAQTNTHASSSMTISTKATMPSTFLTPHLSPHLHTPHPTHSHLYCMSPLLTPKGASTQLDRLGCLRFHTRTRRSVPPVSTTGSLSTMPQHTARTLVLRHSCTAQAQHDTTHTEAAAEVMGDHQGIPYL